MTGRQEPSATGACGICGGELREGLADIPFTTSTGLVWVRAVPAEICGDCGEAYMQSGVADSVICLIRRVEAEQAEVTVVRFKAA